MNNSSIAAHTSLTRDADGGVLARHDPQPGYTQTGGSDYLLSDGHVKLIKLQYVSVGLSPVGNGSLANNCPGYVGPFNGGPANCQATFVPGD